jgi:hypothetical protein
VRQAVRLHGAGIGLGDDESIIALAHPAAKQLFGLAPLVLAQLVDHGRR